MQLRAQDGYIDAITQGCTPTSPHLVGLASSQMSIPTLHLGGHRGAGISGAGISGAVASRTIGLGVS